MTWLEDHLPKVPAFDAEGGFRFTTDVYEKFLRGAGRWKERLGLPEGQTGDTDSEEEDEEDEEDGWTLHWFPRR